MGRHVTIHETAQAPCWEMGKPQGIQTGRGKSDWIGGGLCGVGRGFVDVADVGWRG